MTIGGRVFKNFEGESFGDISLGKALEVSCDTVFYAPRLRPVEEGRRQQAQAPQGLVLQDRPPVRTRQADRYRSAQRARPAGSRTAPGSRRTGRPTRTSGANRARRTAATSRRSRTRTAPTASRCAAGDSVNYAIGQGDTLLTPIQEAVIYSAIANGGTMYQPSVGKAVISADGKTVKPIKPKSAGRLPDSKETTLLHRQGAGRRRHQGYRGLAVRRLAAGQDPAARQDGYRGGRRQADHLLARDLHQGLRDRHDDLPGRYRIRWPRVPRSARSTRPCTASTAAVSRTSRRRSCRSRRPRCRRSARTAPSPRRRVARTHPDSKQHAGTGPSRQLAATTGRKD